MPDNGSNAVYIVSQYISSVGATKKKDLGRHPHAPPRLGVVSQERYVRNETATDPSAVSIAEEEEAVKEDSWVETCRQEEGGTYEKESRRMDHETLPGSSPIT